MNVDEIKKRRQKLCNPIPPPFIPDSVDPDQAIEIFKVDALFEIALQRAELNSHVKAVEADKQHRRNIRGDG